jgi:hypothetical protein
MYAGREKICEKCIKENLDSKIKLRKMIFFISFILNAHQILCENFKPGS